MSKPDKDSGAGAIVEGDSDAPPAKANNKKKLILFGAIGAVLLLGGGGGAWMLLGGGGGAASHEAAAAEAPAKEGHAAAEGGKEGGEGAHFVDVPAMVVNLRNTDGGSRFLKIHFMLVPGEKATSEELTAKLPLLLDAYQPFLRELRPDDLAGSAAVYRVKEEMLVRAHQTLGDGAVKDVLLQDLIQQ